MVRGYSERLETAALCGRSTLQQRNVPYDSTSHFHGSSAKGLAWPSRIVLGSGYPRSGYELVVILALWQSNLFECSFSALIIEPTSCAIPRDEAHMMGVLPRKSGRLTSAPCSRRSLATCRCRFRIARHKTVRPSRSLTSISAPCCKSNSTISE